MSAEFIEAIGDVIDRKLLELRTCIPARVSALDLDGNRAEVEPLLMGNVNGERVQLPASMRVPVLRFRAGGSVIWLPVEVGTLGVLIVSDRSLDTWLEVGGVVDPEDDRHHDLSDAWFLPAWPGPWTDPPTLPGGVASTSLVLANEDGSGWVELTAAGAVNIRASASVASAGGVTSEVLVDGPGGASLSTSLASSLTEIAAFLGAFGLVCTQSTTLAGLLTAGTYKSLTMNIE